MSGAGPKDKLAALRESVVERRRGGRASGASNAHKLFGVWAAAVAAHYPGTYTPPASAKALAALKRLADTLAPVERADEFLEWIVAHWLHLAVELKRDYGILLPTEPDLGKVLASWRQIARIKARGIDNVASTLSRRAREVAAKTSVSIEEALFALAREQAEAKTERERERLRLEQAKARMEAQSEPARKLAIARDEAAFLVGRAELVAKRIEEDIARLLKVAQQMWILSHRGEDPGAMPPLLSAETMAKLDELLARLRAVGGVPCGGA